MSLPITPKINSFDNIDILSLRGGNSLNKVNHHPENEGDIFNLDFEVVRDEEMKTFDPYSYGDTRVTEKSIANFRRDLMGYVSPLVTKEQELAFQEQIAQMGGLDAPNEDIAKLKVELLSNFKREVVGTIIIEDIIKLLEEQIKIIKQIKDLNSNSKEKLFSACKAIAIDQINYVESLKAKMSQTGMDNFQIASSALKISLADLDTIDLTRYGIDLKPIEQIKIEQQERIKEANQKILDKAEND